MTSKCQVPTRAPLKVKRMTNLESLDVGVDIDKVKAAPSSPSFGGVHTTRALRRYASHGPSRRSITYTSHGALNEFGSISRLAIVDCE
ncbi:hypothetical protein OPT61_g4303 [Boeremia exigua]|uniref:Uncharacterized protein n=1 Tax=Boeremia exigua TaxID=749465 RepID=A0ACC2IEK0_9PLEO|nr:hypothetical protein OPT61_g4303 [Boeremia exigua]